MATPRKPKAAARPVLNGLPFVPYIRVSDLNGRDPEQESYGTENNQRASIEGTAKGHGLHLMAEPFPGAFTDQDVTGSNFNRPAWQRAMKLIEDGKAAGIVAYNQARMSRARMGETLTMVAEVEKLGGTLYDENGPVVTEGIGEIVTALRAWQSRAEWEQRRTDRMTAVENAIGRGVHLTAPYGYAKGPDKRLIVNEAEAVQVRRAFKLRAEGHSWPSIAEQLNASGLKPRPYKRDRVVMQAVWTHKTVRQLVRNEVYTGVAWNGDHRYEDAHDEIVDPALFVRANQTRGVKPIGPSEGYLLSGLVRCSGCGYVMAHNNEAQGRYYRCRAAQHGDGRCPEPATVPAGALEAWVAAEFKSDWLGTTYAPDQADANVIAAEASFDTAKAQLTAAMRLRVLLGDDATTTEVELVEQQIADARTVLRQAENDLRTARMSARGAHLPPELDEDNFDGAKVQDRRLWLSTVYACVVVRRSQRWREPASDRARLVGLDQAPRDGTALRTFVTGLDW